mmetsp:Transcript_24828/g.39871  ORF Transcript_24828/g.39871 Transcript_24828/m.39871 type:complete len:84 (+) Transcript_24828:680-931(+)
MRVGVDGRPLLGVRVIAPLALLVIARRNDGDVWRPMDKLRDPNGGLFGIARGGLRLLLLVGFTTKDGVFDSTGKDPEEPRGVD